MLKKFRIFVWKIQIIVICEEKLKKIHNTTYALNLQNIHHRCIL